MVDAPDIDFRKITANCANENRQLDLADLLRGHFVDSIMASTGHNLKMLAYSEYGSEITFRAAAEACLMAFIGYADTLGPEVETELLGQGKNIIDYVLNKPKGEKNGKSSDEDKTGPG